MVDLSKRRFFKRSSIDDSIVRLPWLARPTHFTDECSRCGKCLDACETKIITIQDGGFPCVDFSIDECTFCYHCAEICPELLFLPKVADPWNAKVNINDECLAYKNVECRSCSETCEMMAITFKPELGKVAQPKLNKRDCNGCGACVSICPTSSISIENDKQTP